MNTGQIYEIKVATRGQGQLRFLNIDAKMPSRPLTKMMRIRKDVDVDGQQMLLVLFRSINLL